MLRWGIAHVATHSALAAGSFAIAFLSAVSSGGMVLHGLGVPNDVTDGRGQGQAAVSE